MNRKSFFVGIFAAGCLVAGPVVPSFEEPLRICLGGEDMPYDAGKSTHPCIVCNSHANIVARLIDKVVIDCSRCGDFFVLRDAEDDFLPLKDRKQRKAASRRLHHDLPRM